MLRMAHAGVWVQKFKRSRPHAANAPDVAVESVPRPSPTSRSGQSAPHAHFFEPANGVYLKSERHIPSAIHAFHGRPVIRLPVPFIAVPVEGDKHPTIGLPGNSSVWDHRTLILFRTRNPGKTSGTPLFEGLSGFFEAPVTHRMDCAGHGIVTEYRSPIIVGYSGLPRQCTRGIRILPHVANVDDGFDVIRVPTEGHQLGIIIAAVPGKKLRGLEHQGMTGVPWLQ